MATPRANLFDEVCARLPLFEDLPRDAPERLAAAGLGRGLLTAAVRARLRRAGFADMGTLAIATPADLTKIRKIGPVRLQAIRGHVLDELARIYPEVRAVHADDATAARRMDRLRAVPADRLPLTAAALRAAGCTGETCANLAMRGRHEWLVTGAVAAGDLDAVVTGLVAMLSQDRPRPPRVTQTVEDDPAADGMRARERRAGAIREQDREWDEAAPDFGTRGS